MNKVQRIITIIFLVVGIVLLGIGAYLHFVPAIPPEFVGTTDATITDIDTVYSNSTSNGRRNTHMSVLVKYEVDGKEWERELGYYETGMAVGGTVSIQYDTRDPSKISSPAGRKFGAIITLVLGAVFLVLSGVLMKVPVHVTVHKTRTRR